MLRRRLTVVSWNIHKCIGGLDRRYDPDRTAAVIAHAEPDLVLLQEVAQNGSHYRFERQVDELCDRLALPHHSYAVNVHFGKRRGEYGNAVLSKLPITATENVDLTLPRKKARSALHVELRVPLGEHSRTLHAFDLHLGLSERERREQLRRLLISRPMLAIRARTPTLVAGDFNDVYGTLGKRLLAPEGFRGPRRAPRTFPSWAPVRALDSLWLRGDAELIELHRPRTRDARAASDHLPLVAQIDVGGQATHGP
ncbi:MAG: endonuclease/exonuclease/phosphatase family protein [bacterium]|nr:endonuclease/exonuclease/phosphatase family protein [bacterium]